MNFHYGRGKSPSPLAARPILRKRKPRDVSRGQIVDKPSVCQRDLPDRLSSHCVAYGGPVFRRCALRVLAPPAASRPPTASGRDGNAFLRFAPTLNSAWSFHCARKLACGSPCFIGLTTACFRHWRRPPCAPALRLRGVPALRTPFGRVLAPSALRAFTFSQAFALQKMPEMTYTPSFLMRASFFRDFVNTLSTLYIEYYNIVLLLYHK